MSEDDSEYGYGYGSGQQEQGSHLPSKAVIVALLFLVGFWFISNTLGDYKIIPSLPSMNEWQGTLPTAALGALILFVWLKMRQKRNTR